MPPRRTGGKKSQKDPDAPKRPLSSYMLFAKDARARIIEDKPHLASKVAEVGKLIGAEWKTMTPETKAPYEKAAGQEKLRYQEAIKQYKAKKHSKTGMA